MALLEHEMNQMILPAVTAASGVFAGCALLYRKLRPYFPVKVNCWFCNRDTKVAIRHCESWYCPFCQQYNGFTEDGDYNRDLPAHYCESLNLTSHQHKGQQAGSRKTLSIGNGFCQTCNLNQTLKVQALADYTPIHSENYDKEIDEYRKRLEKTYALCRTCEATLHQTLGKQDSWLKPKLMTWRLKKAAKNKTKIVSNWRQGTPGTPISLHLLRLLGFLISVILFLSNLNHLQQDSGRKVLELDFGLGLKQYLDTLHVFMTPLIIGGLTFFLVCLFHSGKENLRVSDAITSFVWTALFVLCSSKQVMSNRDHNSLQVLLSGICVLLTAWTLFLSRIYGWFQQKQKRNLNKNRVSETSTRKLDELKYNLSRSLTDKIPDPFPQIYHEKKDISFITENSVGNYMPANTEDATLGLDATLGSLKISTPLKEYSRSHTSRPISPKQLFSEKGVLYNRKVNTNSHCVPKNLLRPSRLSTKNITQSSWVAGGYWGHSVGTNRDFSSNHVVPLLSHIPSFSHSYPLSRSSSQSSGYISQGSGPNPSKNQGPCSLPSSLHGSMCGDLDQGSLLSEPAYKPWNIAPSLYPSDSASQCSHSKPLGQIKFDDQSIHSCSSTYSDCSQHIRSSPITTSSTVYHNTHSNTSLDFCCNDSLQTGVAGKEKQESVIGSASITCNQHSSFSYRNPWFAFFLGMSFAANGFLLALLCMHTDLKFWRSS